MQAELSAQLSEGKSWGMKGGKWLKTDSDLIKVLGDFAISF